MVIVCADEYRQPIADMRETYGLKKPAVFAPAGESRQASVLSGLRLVETERVMIHEAARPFVREADYRRLMANPAENAIFGAPIPFTVVRGHGEIEGLLDRPELVNVQLPQIFRTRPLLEAHLQARREGRTFTEDASLLFHYRPDLPIRIVPGMDYNIKVTTAMDLLTGEMIFKEIFG